MTTYATGNPVPSTEVKDLYDNAQNLDTLVNDRTKLTHPDRLGVPRKTWHGIETQAQLDIASAVAEATAQADSARDAAEDARDDALAAAGAIGPLKFYPTRAAAEAALPGLGEDDLVEVAQDESADGARTRYRVSGGVLVFVVNLDQLRQDLAEPAGSESVGYERVFDGSEPWDVYEKLGSMAVDVLDAIPKSQRAAILAGTSVYDAGPAINKAIIAAKGAALNFGSHKFFTATPLDFKGWTGAVLGTAASVVFASGVTMAAAADFSNANGVFWSGLSLDLGQSSATVEADNRVRAGLYMKDARNCTFRRFDFKNVRVGQIIYIDGTSSVSPLESHGSKDIAFEGVNCNAFAYSTLDIGTAVYIRSDFYADTGGGAYFAASNACKVSDYTLDAAVAYARTTARITFNNCIFKNFDRIGYFNVRDVHMTNVQLINFYTRGHSLSPSCENVTVVGGSISGNAAQINANYACRNLVFSSLVALGMSSSTGQRHALRCGFGTNAVRFTDIVGYGNDVSQLYIEGAFDIVFSGISLNNWNAGVTTVALTVVGGPAGNASSFNARDIKLVGCTLGANYGLSIATTAGTATVAQRAVAIEGCRFNKTFQLFLGAQPTNGQICWSNSYASVSGSAQDLDSRAFAYYSGGNLNLRKWDSYAWTTAGAPYATFANVYFPATVRDGAGGDATRDIPVRAFIKKSGQPFFLPLVYGIDWFIDAASAASGMVNQIRMYSTANFAVGDTVAVERVN